MGRDNMSVFVSGVLSVVWAVTLMSETLPVAPQVIYTE
jgi:hypothetical protein